MLRMEPFEVEEVTDPAPAEQGPFARAVRVGPCSGWRDATRFVRSWGAGKHCRELRDWWLRRVSDVVPWVYRGHAISFFGIERFSKYLRQMLGYATGFGVPLEWSPARPEMPAQSLWTEAVRECVVKSVSWCIEAAADIVIEVFEARPEYIGGMGRGILGRSSYDLWFNASVRSPINIRIDTHLALEGHWLLVEHGWFHHHHIKSPRPQVQFHQYHHHRHRKRTDKVGEDPGI